MASSVGMPVMTGSGLLSMDSSFLRVLVISTKLGEHRGWESDEGWCGIKSCGGVASTSAVVVAHMAVVAGWPSLWVTDTAPLGWALMLWVQLFWDSCGNVSINHGEITSIQLEGTLVMKISSSFKEMSSSIVCQSSCTLLSR